MTTSTAIDSKYFFLTHSTGKTHYYRVGPENGPIVVMVSGATLPMAVWKPLVTPLVDSGFQIVLYDLPGRGHTPLEGQGVSFQAHLDQLHSLIDGLEIRQPIHLIGLASGALIVAAYTEKYRAQVSHICLIAPDGASTHFTFKERMLSTPILGKFLIKFTAKRTLFARVPRYSRREDIQNYVRNLLDFSIRCPGFNEAVLATIRTFPLHHGEGLYQRLAKLQVPTSIIWGSDDYITPPDATDSLLAIFGEDALHTLQNVGHLPFAEDPLTVATIIENHFRGTY